MPYMKQIRMPELVEVTDQTMFSPKNQGLEFDQYYGVTYMRENNDGLVVVGIEILDENKHARVLELPFMWFSVVSWVEKG
jgi:hypothetical protein